MVLLARLPDALRDDVDRAVAATNRGHAETLTMGEDAQVAVYRAALAAAQACNPKTVGCGRKAHRYANRRPD